MSLQSYADLQTAVASWLNRDDLTTQIPDFIRLAEARIRRNQEWWIQTYSNEVGSNLTVGVNPILLPSYVREVLSIWADTSLFKHTIEILPPEAWRDLAASNRNAAGTPTKAAIIPEMGGSLTEVSAPGQVSPMGLRLYLWPTPDDPAFAVDFLYVRDLPTIESGPVNFFLRHPDLYLYGALGESAPFLQHDERVPVWEARYQQAVKEVNVERERAQFSASAKRVRLPKAF